MVLLEKFYAHARVVPDPRITSSTRMNNQHNRIVEQFNRVVERLSDEEQFETTCNIYIANEDLIQNFLIRTSNQLPIDNLNTLSAEADIIFLDESLGDIQYAFILVIDNLDVQSDDYIMGLIAYKFSEWSHFWREITNVPNWNNLGEEERREIVDRLHSSRLSLGDGEREEYERSIIAEVKRLGFFKEFTAYDIH